MQPNDISDLFDLIDKNTAYKCSKIQDDPLSYAIETRIPLIGSFHIVSISATFFLEAKKILLYTYISDGYSGKKADLLSQLLLRLNTMLFSGSFGIWSSNGDIIYSKQIDGIRRLTKAGLCKQFDHCVTVYKVMRPYIDIAAGRWSLQAISEKDLDRISEELSTKLDNIRRDLPAE